MIYVQHAIGYRNEIRSTIHLAQLWSSYPAFVDCDTKNSPRNLPSEFNANALHW